RLYDASPSTKATRATVCRIASSSCARAGGVGNARRAARAAHGAMILAEIRIESSSGQSRLRVTCQRHPEGIEPPSLSRNTICVEPNLATCHPHSIAVIFLRHMRCTIWFIIAFPLLTIACARRPNREIQEARDGIAQAEKSGAPIYARGS